MTDFLIKKWIRDPENISDNKVRENYGILGSLIGIMSNLLLFFAKLIVGIVTKSVTITADAFNNFSDMSSSLVTLLGFKLSGKEPDEEHPFGHGRIEYISGLIIAFLIFLVGFEFIKTSVRKILHMEAVEFRYAAVVILILSVLVKFWMSRAYLTISKKINSLSLKAASVDSLNDVAITLVILVSYVISPLIKFPIDGYMGVLVSCFILYAGYGILKETVNSLLGQKPDKELVEQIYSKILAYSDIRGVHDLIIHSYGPNKFMASVHAEVDIDGDFVKLHDIIDDAERDILRDLGVIVSIHMDPIATNDERTNRLKELVEEKLAEIDPTLGIHDFRIVPGESHTNLIFDVVVPFQYKIKTKDLKRLIDQKIKEENPTYETVITFDQGYV